jgi:hypothetical protein
MISARTCEHGHQFYINLKNADKSKREEKNLTQGQETTATTSKETKEKKNMKEKREKKDCSGNRIIIS